MRNHSLLRPLTAAAAALLLTACATTESDGPSADDYLGDLAQRVSANGAAVVGDGCVISDKPGRRDVIVRDASVTIGEAAADGLTRTLSDNNAGPAPQPSPVFCAGTEAIELDRRVRIGDEVRDRGRNLPLSDTVLTDIDDTTAIAWMHLLDRVKTVALSDTSSTYGARALDLPEGTAETLAGVLDHELVWVYRVFGIAVDDAAAAQARFGTSTFDGFGPSNVNEDGSIRNQDEEDSFGYVVALVDLPAGEILWYKRSTNNNGDPRSPERFYRSWAMQALTPFYPR